MRRAYFAVGGTQDESAFSCALRLVRLFVDPRHARHAHRVATGQELGPPGQVVEMLTANFAL